MNWDSLNVTILLWSSSCCSHSIFVPKKSTHLWALLKWKTVSCECRAWIWFEFYLDQVSLFTFLGLVFTSKGSSRGLWDDREPTESAVTLAVWRLSSVVGDAALDQQLSLLRRLPCRHLLGIWGPATRAPSAVVEQCGPGESRPGSEWARSLGVAILPRFLRIFECERTNDVAY